jgi:hypothetical protein
MEPGCASAPSTNPTGSGDGSGAVTYLTCQITPHGRTLSPSTALTPCPADHSVTVMSVAKGQDLDASRVTEQPVNAGVLQYLAPRSATVARPTPATDTWRLGAHPDIVEQLWTRLNAALPADCRFLVADTATLVDPTSGVILALALGTQYAIRLSGDGLGAARSAGFETSHEFATVSRTLDLAATLGHGWVFGRHDAREGEWLAETARTANL